MDGLGNKGMVYMDMDDMVNKDNSLDMGYKGVPRMGHTKDRTICFPKDSM